MAETTLLAEKQLIRKRRPLLRVVSDETNAIPVVKINRELKSNHKFFVNTLFCEMFAKI